MADTKRKTAPPNVGDRPTIRVTTQFAADVATVMTHLGSNFTDAVRTAVHEMAERIRRPRPAGLPANQLVADLELQTKHDLNVLISPRTGRLPEPLATAVREAAQQRHTAWTTTAG